MKPEALVEDGAHRNVAGKRPQGSAERLQGAAVHQRSGRDGGATAEAADQSTPGGEEDRGEGLPGCGGQPAGRRSQLRGHGAHEGLGAEAGAAPAAVLIGSQRIGGAFRSGAGRPPGAPGLGLLG